MALRSWQVGALLVSVGLGLGCQARSSSPAPVSPAEQVDADDVRIDLGPSGMAASILAPRHARATATPYGIELVGGVDFHLYVVRGGLDTLAEKANIVRRYGDEFYRFLRDRGTEVVFETSSMSGPRFHFFFVNDEDIIPYHCRTPEDGVGSLSAVDQMLEACRDVRFNPDVEPSLVAPAHHT